MEKYWKSSNVYLNPTNQEMVNEFLLSQKVENQSKGTVIRYREYLDRFFKNRKEVYSSVTSDDILQWITEQHANMKETTISNRLSILSSFFNFCIQESLIESSPIKKRWFPRLPKPVPQYLEKEDIAKLRHRSEKDSLRNQAMIEFFLSSGCRVSELHSLDRSDVNLENRTAHVLGKGGKIRMVNFSEKCAVLLERYLASSNQEATALFVMTTGRRIGIRRIQIIVRNIGREAAVESRLSPHRLRHTFATELLAKGADLSFISDELGHTDVSTTQIYARLPKREIISLYRKYRG